MNTTRTLDQYETAVAAAIAASLFFPPDLWPKGIEVGLTVLRAGGYDLDAAHGDFLAPEVAALAALDEFALIRAANAAGGAA